MSHDSDLINKIKEELFKSGFPLEMKCRNRIIRDWNPSLYRFYLDNDNNEHEIDLIAGKQVNITTTKSRASTLNSQIILECKKSDSNHWVFFDEPDSMPSLSVITNLPERSTFRLKYLGLRSLDQHHYLNTPTTVGYCCVFQTPKRSQIFEAIEQVSNAYAYEISGVIPNMKLRPASKEGVWVNIYYPLIVFDGKLFVARLNGEDIDVEEKKHVLYCALHESKLNLPETFDIVTYDYLEEYLTVLDKSHKVTVDYFQQVAKRYNRTPTS